MINLYFLLVGVVTGLAAGLLGVSGGVIIIPALVFLLPMAGVPKADLMHISIGTSLASMVLTSLSSTYSHHKKGSVLWPLFWRLFPGILGGAVLGAYLAKLIPNRELRIIFAFFEICVGLYMLVTRKGEHLGEGKSGLSFMKSLAVGVSVGTLSAMLGIGGGLLLVPTLAYFHVPLKKAVGSSAATGLVISLTGGLTFLLLGLNGKTGSQAGFLYLPALFWISIVSMLAAPIGVKWAHFLSGRWLRRIFGMVLTLAGILLLVNQF